MSSDILYSEKTTSNNYRTLNIHLTSQTLTLTFGVFSWNIPLENIERCAIDELPTIARYFLYDPSTGSAASPSSRNISPAYAQAVAS
jgi:hypothetical protein